MIIISREGSEVLPLQAKDFHKFFKAVSGIKIFSKYKIIKYLFKSKEKIKIWDQNKEILAKAHSVQVYLQLCHQDREAYMKKTQLASKINIQEIIAAKAL